MILLKNYIEIIKLNLGIGNWELGNEVPKYKFSDFSDILNSKIPPNLPLSKGG
jgi:hypothetical protein